MSNLRKHQINDYGKISLGQKLIPLYYLCIGFLLCSYTPANNNTNLGKTNDDILFKSGSATTLYVDKNEQPVVNTTISILSNDIATVFNNHLKIAGKPTAARIIAGTIAKNSEIDRLVKAGKVDVSGIKGKWETFLIKVINDGSKKLIIAGSDSRGTAYGLLEVSRMIGVSPWAWWADAKPLKKDVFLMPSATIVQSPNVQYRGIFLNDEDWGLNPWSSKTFEPGTPTTGKTKGAIGPKTYAKIFELLLRLRANTIWPAMHEVTTPFYFVKGNKEMADKYGIVVGTSHCEPLMRNSASEWDSVGKGDYNYITNHEAILSYWTERLHQLQSTEHIYTIGMRGKHDGMMQGVETLEQHKAALTQIISDQRKLLGKYVNNNVAKIPQVFVPYKEVLDVYNAGLQVPDDVTLMWCDDNYGYISHFPDEKEQDRSGGNGVYYHISYWGRPHDYLWLGTANPALLYQQMSLAYEKNARKIWILNVGDIKPSEYQLELFFDMAWDIKKIRAEGTSKHLQTWLQREFGNVIGNRLFPVMEEHYRLSYIRKPEFLGNTRTEEKDPKYSVVTDLPWSEREIEVRLSMYKGISDSIEKISTEVPVSKQSAFYELAKYPVQAATQMNNKMLFAQLARHGEASWSFTDAAYDSIVSMTRHYNGLENGKWNQIMDYAPRKLPVFDRVQHINATDSEQHFPQPLCIINGADFVDTDSVTQGLGYEGKALALQKGSTVALKLDSIATDSVVVEVRLLPNHPVEGDQLRFTIGFDQTVISGVPYQTQGRSEEWKQNVLRNQAIRKFTFPVTKQAHHELRLTALDAGVVVDQIFVYGK